MAVACPVGRKKRKVKDKDERYKRGGTGEVHINFGDTDH